MEVGTITVFGHREPGEYTFAMPLSAGLVGAATAGASAAAGETVLLDIRVEEIEPVSGMSMEAHPGAAAAAADEGAPVTPIAVSTGG